MGKLDILLSQYQTFARRVEDILTGQRSIVQLDQSLEKSARGAARKIFKKQSEELSDRTECDFQSVDVNSFAVESPRSLGAEYLCYYVWKELEMDEFFSQKGVSAKVTPLLEALIVRRLVAPGSERYTKQWAERRSALFELVGYPLRHSLNSYYRAGDTTLFSLKKALEEHLCIKEKYPKAAKLYNVEVIPDEEKPATDKNLRAVDIIWERKDVKYKRETLQEGS